jgi:hypothetical protein
MLPVKNKPPPANGEFAPMPCVRTFGLGLLAAATASCEAIGHRPYAMHLGRASRPHAVP